MKAEFVEKIWLLVVDKLILASILGVGLFIFSGLADARLERLKSDLITQQVITQERIDSSDALWSSLYGFGVALKMRLASGSGSGLRKAYDGVEDAIRNEGRFIGIDEALSFREELRVAADIDLLMELIEKHNAGKEGAKEDLESYWVAFAEDFWFPMLRKLEASHLSQRFISE